MKVYIKGKGETELSQSDFLAQGGEGSVYAKGQQAFKIYNDPDKMIPLGKIQELSSLTSPYIIKPEDILCNSKNKIIGYTMKYVKDTYALCQLFPKSFKQRNNINPSATFDMVKKLYDIIKHVHEKGILIVDLNEMNFLFDNKFQNIYAIDVDSYQTPSFHATALMESIRDRHSNTNQFNQGTDWFAFSIVSFQMLIGIHPYKGKHPSVKDLDDRMIRNISVLNKDVSIPNACLDFSVIPKNYMSWFKAVLDEGKRLAPPEDGQIFQVIQKINTVVGNNNFDIKELFDAMDEIIRYVNNGIEICLTKTNAFINKKSIGCKLSGVIGVSPKLNKTIIAENYYGKLKLFEAITGKELPCISDVDSLMEYDNRIYFKNGMNICEIIFYEMGAQIMAIPKIVGKVMPNSILHTFGGVIIQDIMGIYYASLFPASGMCHQVKINILTGYKIIEAKFENKVLMIIAAKNGKYDKFILRFNDDYSEFDTRCVSNVDYSGLNFTVLDNGFCVHITEEETLEIFSNRKDSTGIKVIDDPVIKNDMQLSKNGTTTVFTQGSKVYSLKTK